MLKLNAGLISFRFCAKNVNVDSGTLYMAILIFCSLVVEAEMPPNQFPLLIPQKQLSVHHIIFYWIEPSETY